MKNVTVEGSKYDLSRPYSSWEGDKGRFWIETESSVTIGAVNHIKKTVSPIHGYYGNGSVNLRKIATKLKYKYTEKVQQF